MSEQHTATYSKTKEKETCGMKTEPEYTAVKKKNKKNVSDARVYIRKMNTNRTKRSVQRETEKT